MLDKQEILANHRNVLELQGLSRNRERPERSKLQETDATPNVITPVDFAGFVQRQNLGCAHAQTVQALFQVSLTG